MVAGPETRLIDEADRRAERLVDAGVFTPAAARVITGDDSWRTTSALLAHPSSGLDPEVFKLPLLASNPGTDRDCEGLSEPQSILAFRPSQLSQKVIVAKDLLNAQLIWSIAIRKAEGNEEVARAYVQKNHFIAQGNY